MRDCHKGGKASAGEACDQIGDLLDDLAGATSRDGVHELSDLRNRETHMQKRIATVVLIIGVELCLIRGSTAEAAEL